MLMLDRTTALNLAGLILIAGGLIISGLSIYLGKDIDSSIQNTLPWITLGLTCLGVNAGFTSLKAQLQSKN